MDNMKKIFNLLLLLSIVPAILIVTNAMHFNIAYAALTQEHVNQLREMLKGVNNNLQINSTSSASNTLSTIINNITKSVCNMAICPSDTVHSEKADITRTPLNDAMKSIQSGNLIAAQSHITNANSTLNELVK